MHDFCITGGGINRVVQINNPPGDWITLKVTHFLCLRRIGYAAVLLVVVVCHLLWRMDPYTNRPIVWKGLGYTGPWSD